MSLLLFYTIATAFGLIILIWLYITQNKQS